ncbi:MAG: hypothetical protein BJ554DRAFT_2454 [Olpidium bornovanus]|uniref:Uncharacterized protein n=1 Tax=Olpidium bornovanus TaxID=278681 RepID=A0A8H8DGL7_9FUNG|nr:MAG: hypothetical protein BJ554DRAFT_2454 [Olpidium bornovanus]
MLIKLQNATQDVSVFGFHVDDRDSSAASYPAPTRAAGAAGASDAAHGLLHARSLAAVRDDARRRSSWARVPGGADVRHAQRPAVPRPAGAGGFRGRPRYERHRPGQRRRRLPRPVLSGGGHARRAPTAGRSRRVHVRGPATAAAPPPPRAARERAGVLCPAAAAAAAAPRSRSSRAASGVSDGGRNPERR